MGILDEVAGKVKTAKSNIDVGNAQTESLGRELSEKARMVRESRGAGDMPSAAPAVTPAPKANTGAKYGDKAGEKRIDVKEALKPLGSFKDGTPHVPRTGMYKLHAGEAVIPKEKNTMNAADAMAGITGNKAKPEKKIHKIITHKTDDGKMIHTHLHHHPSYHPDETHVSNNIGQAQDHMATMEPNMSAQAPPMPEAGAAGAAGAAPTGM